MAHDFQINDPWCVSEYFMKCSDCESDQESCFSAEQSIEFAKRDGWLHLGTRIVCPECAKGYPQE